MEQIERQEEPTTQVVERESLVGVQCSAVLCKQVPTLTDRERTSAATVWICYGPFFFRWVLVVLSLFRSLSLLLPRAGTGYRTCSREGEGRDVEGRGERYGGLVVVGSGYGESTNTPAMTRAASILEAFGKVWVASGAT